MRVSTYPPGTLKTPCCLRGKQLLYGYCSRHGITAKRCGKLIVACSENQRENLRALQYNAARSGLDDLQWLEREQVFDMEPDVRASAALYLPSTGIVDVHEPMLSLLADLEAAGGVLVTHSKVLAARAVGGGIELEIDDGEGGLCSRPHGH